MDFTDKLKQFSTRVNSLKGAIATEEATKTSIIMPFFAMLGYDVFNPQEFVPEFTADVGIKKGEKVDYAIINNGEPAILIEAKSVSENLEKHDSQLFRYFGTTNAKFAILTNGVIYRFYTDLDQPNKMDEDPFLEVNILDIKENQVAELKKFGKNNFSVDEIFDSASSLKYASQFKALFAQQLSMPTDDFVGLFLQNTYSGRKTQAVLDKFRVILKKSLNDYISETMNEKIKSALGQSSEPVADEEPSIETAVAPDEPHQNKIVTTEEELEAYFLVKSILKGIVPHSDIVYKDTESYINILYKNNVRKWICRLKLTSSAKILILPDAAKKEVKHTLGSIYDIETHRDELVAILKRYVQ